MSSKRPVNLTINERILVLADRIMALRGYSSFSVFVEDLIRTEYDSRCPPLTWDDENVATSADALNESGDSYKAPPRTRGREPCAPPSPSP